MCPVCLATLSLVVAGVISTGGATALAAKTMLHRQNGNQPNASAVTRAAKESESPEKKEKQS